MTPPLPAPLGGEDLSPGFSIRSQRILRNTIYAMTAIVGLLTLAEWTVDFKATEKGVVVSFWVCYLAMTALAMQQKHPAWLVMVFNVLVYTTVEVHALLNPTAYHVINFWFVCVPVISLITAGARHSLVWALVTLISIMVNGWGIRAENGNEYLLTVYVIPLMVGGLIFNLTVYSASFLLYQLMKEAYLNLQLNSRSLTRLKQEAEAKNARLESYIEVMSRMSREEAVLEGNMELLFSRICEAAVVHLGITRVSIWEMGDTWIERKYISGEDPVPEEPLRLRQEDYPAYFRAIRTTSLVSADYAMIHPSTREFTEAYLRPLHIVSMLDATFSVDDRQQGLICCENQYTVRHWTAEDRLFVQSLAGLISVGYNSHQSRAFLERIRLQNQEMYAQQIHIEEMNEELKTINGTLEKHVQERTRKLEEKNAQLTEYAFINSHLLRAPLARILGVTTLIGQFAEKGIIDPVLVNSLLRSGEELDEIVRTISTLLYEGKELSRKEVEEIVYRKLNPRP